jgi:hypothetical protein
VLPGAGACDVGAYPELEEREMGRSFASFRGWVLVPCMMACSGSGSSGAGRPAEAASTTGADDAGAAASRASMRSAPSDGGAKDDRAFAGSTAEATELISVAVDRKQSEIMVCVREFRTRRKGTGRVAVSFGIDQEGRVLGVTPKGNEDLKFTTCVQDALRGAGFPRSHAGVITVTKTYEDILQ